MRNKKKKKEKKKKRKRKGTRIQKIFSAVSNLPF